MNEKMRLAIAEELGRMAEMILRREPPFENLPVHEEVAHHLHFKYLKFFDEIDATFRRKILDGIIEEAKWYFIVRSLPVQERFDEKFPHHVETLYKFRSWLKSREEEVSTYQSLYKPTGKINLNQIIKDVVEKRMPQFVYNSKEGSSTDLVFTKPWLSDKTVHIMVDKGSRRDFLSFFIGFNLPHLESKNDCYSDISSLFGGVQSVYPYSDNDGVAQSTNNALDIIEIILPHFIESMEKVVSH